MFTWFSGRNQFRPYSSYFSDKQASSGPSGTVIQMLQYNQLVLYSIIYIQGSEHS